MEPASTDSPTPPPPDIGQPNDELSVERRDRTLRNKTFKSWLRDHAVDDPRFQDLDDVINHDPHFKGREFLRVDFEKWCNVLVDIGRDELIETLLFATTEWHADSLARSKGAGSLSVSSAVVAGSIRARAGGVTAEMPVPTVQCGWKNRRGTRCEEMALPGALRCAKHGGDWLDPMIRQRLLLAAYMRLVEGAELAVDALIEVVAHGKREDARVMAAREILDRAGIRTGVDIHVVVDDHETAALESGQVNEILKRLDKMAEGLMARDELEARQKAVRDAEIIDAEVIEETDGEERS